MLRYWRIYGTFFGTSFRRELEFRANFFAKILQNFVWMGFYVVIILVVYRNTDSVAGWGRGEAFMLGATCFLMNAFVSGFAMAIAEIPQHVRMGTLDFVITKPVDTQFYVSMRRFNFDQIGTLIAGVLVMAIGLHQSKIETTPAQWLGYVVLAFASIALFYALKLMMMTLGIWWVRVDNIWVLAEMVTEFARYPVDIFGAAIVRFMTYAIPLAFLASIPCQQLVRGFDGWMVLLGVFWGFAFLVLARLFWRFALRSYSSASS